MFGPRVFGSVQRGLKMSQCLPPGSTTIRRSEAAGIREFEAAADADPACRNSQKSALYGVSSEI
jgi:hypothetical protein